MGISPISSVCCGVSVPRAAGRKRARRLYPSLPSRRRQAAAARSWLGARVQARRLSAQVHVRDGRVKLYTMNAADWTERYPRIVKAAARIKGAAILDAEVVCLSPDGVPDFDALHSRTMD